MFYHLSLSIRLDFLNSHELRIFINHIALSKLRWNHHLEKWRFNFMVELRLTFPFYLHYTKD